MVTRTIYEERILREIQDLPEPAQEKLEKLIRFFKQELITAQTEPDEKMKKLFKDLYESRQSENGREPALS